MHVCAISRRLRSYPQEKGKKLDSSDAMVSYPCVDEELSTVLSPRSGSRVLNSRASVSVTHISSCLVCLKFGMTRCSHCLVQRRGSGGAFVEKIYGALAHSEWCPSEPGTKGPGTKGPWPRDQDKGPRTRAQGLGPGPEPGTRDLMQGLGPRDQGPAARLHSDKVWAPTEAPDPGSYQIP